MFIANGLVYPTVGDFKRDLAKIPDDYSLSLVGEDSFSMVVDYDNKTVLFDHTKLIQEQIEEFRERQNRRMQKNGE